MSIKRRRARSKNRVEYIQVTDSNGDEFLYIKKGGVIVEEIQLYPVKKNEHGEKVMTIKQDGVEQTIPVDDFIADNGGRVKNITISKSDSFTHIDNSKRH